MKDRKKVFTDAGTVKKYSDALADITEKNSVRNWIYVFMPDHLHVMLEGMSCNSDSRKALIKFKQKTSVMYGKIWQKDFYDRILREDENIYHHLLYIANNPVRKGLCGKFENYYGLGSLDFDIKEIIKNLKACELSGKGNKTG